MDIALIAVLVFAVSTAAQAQAPSPTHFSGIINDYTAATGVGGPWEMHGTWSLKLKGDSGKADFSAVMTMEHPDSWIAANPGTPPNLNVDNPGTRSPHTHHLTMTDALVSYNPSVCPATTVRFLVTGPADITGNGTAAPFQTKGGTIHAAGLHHQRNGGPVFERDPDVCGYDSCDWAFRKPAYPRRRSQDTRA